ncbi:M42 family metallopeptidase [Alicyclobacillus dauci]|uniref:M42 family metallopeptidase n=1 Tax=Alicyclobacillus dauci TaxID=1475485 RepID=A0ABY6YZF3_9BACL|nr:M42 family metallopeptidase [Alicyclobacillus dauci]WAH35844.1 M42 family metallopeptidase [Alicyclobacillus dauci]
MEPYTYIQDLLVRLLNTPSPTGHTGDIIRLLQTESNRMGLRSSVTTKGALLIQVPGVQNGRRRFLTAHVDTLGGMVKQVLDNGRLRVQRIGGYAWNTVEGEYCGVLASSGQTVSGTILLHNTSVHVNREVGETKRTDENMEIVLDARVKDKADVAALGIQVGDFVAWDPRVVVTDTGYIKSRHLDDKASVAILFGLLQHLVETKSSLPHELDILISNNEEIGYGGNSNISPEIVEYLAVDMGAIGDGLTTDEHCVSICAMDGSGPYHEGFRRQLVHLATEAKLQFAVDIYPFYSSDASAAVRAGADIRHALIGPGVANSHAYERTHVDALRNTFQLLDRYVRTEIPE